MDTKTSIEKTTSDIQDIWKSYKLQQDGSLREKLVLNYISLVRSVMKSISIPANSILTRDDLISSGIIGLIDAIEKYDLDRGVKFETYAVQRIKGAILDELRKVDWLSRTARQKVTEVNSTLDSIQSETGAEATFPEAISKLNIKTSEINTYLLAYRSSKEGLFINETLFNGDEEETPNFLENLPDESQKNPLDVIIDEEKISIIMDYLNTLPERNRLIITLHYYENLKFKEIGKLLNISESRVSQVHSEVIRQLKKKFRMIEE